MKYTSAAAALAGTWLATTTFTCSNGFTFQANVNNVQTSATQLHMASSSENDNDRRAFFDTAKTFVLGTMSAGLISNTVAPLEEAEAIVYLDPAMYGDQEMRVSAVDSLREAVRRAILQKPELAPSFYTLSIMDALSFDAKTRQGGPDGRIVRELLSAKATPEDKFISNLQEAALVLVTAGKNLRRMTAITVADSVALGGAAAVESVGGPVLSTQLGRTDFGKTTGLAVPSYYPALDLLSGKRPQGEVVEAFRKAGLTDREMTAILGALMTIDVANKDRQPDANWKKSQKGKFAERGKMGRMSDFKKLTDEDIAELEQEEEDDLYGAEKDDGWYIAETFGTRDSVFGQKVGGGAGLTSKNFNKYLNELNEYSAVSVSKKTGKTTLIGNEANQPYGWVGDVLLDPQNVGVQSWLAKYASQPLSYNKDLGTAYNSVTQLGGEYTGGKYESLLNNKPRKTLNDF
jgi:hypothetical protein